MQSRLESLFESMVNIATGMLVSFLLGMAVYPSMGFPVTPSQNALIVAIFTAASLLRTYIWRRWFNRLLVRRLTRG